MRMFRFPEKIFSDVRIETRRETRFYWRGKSLQQRQVRNDETAFVRVYDGRRWFYSSVTDTGEIQSELDRLAAMASLSNLRGNPVLDAFQTNKGLFGAVPDLPADPEEKRKAAEAGLFLPDWGFDDVFWAVCYEDRHITRRIISSKGADLTVESGGAGYRYRFKLSNQGKNLSADRMNYSESFNDLFPDMAEIREYLKRCSEFNRHAVVLPRGNYKVILSPVCAGLFAHESFGHKSEADFMTGQGALIRRWPIGTRVASDILSIIDDGSAPGVGRINVDDEGTLCRKTWLIRDGVLTGRLHSVESASHFGEKPTGNARAVNCGYEPIVRMTNTSIQPGTTPLDQLIGEVDNGIYVENIRGGTGSNRFTMNPDLAWRISGGKITEPVRISVLAGEVKKTLLEVDGVSSGCEMFGSVDSGCGKFGQTGLRVGFGGPYVRVRSMEVI